MKEILNDRAPVADADNGFVYVLGFGVPPPEDPQVPEARCVKHGWSRSTAIREQIDAEPMKKDVGLQDVDVTVRGRPEDGLRRCPAHENAATLSWRPCRSRALALDDLQLARYRALAAAAGVA